MEIIDKIKTIKTNKELTEYKRKIDEAFEERGKFITLCEIADNNSCKSFGYIKEAFENISPLLFNTKDGNKIINKYIKTIKENKNLSSLNTLYENIRKANADSDIDFFVNNIANTEWSVNKNVKNDTLKLGRILAEGILYAGEKCVEYLPKENKSLDDVVLYLSENKKTKNNIAEFSNAVKIIKEHVSNNKGENLFETTDIDSYAEKALDAFNKKYSNLSEDEKEVIKKIGLSENKEEIFNQYKEECLTKLSSYMSKENNDETVKLTEVYNKVKNKNFIIENIGVDICGFIELTKLFG